MKFTLKFKSIIFRTVLPVLFCFFPGCREEMDRVEDVILDSHGEVIRVLLEGDVESCTFGTDGMFWIEGEAGIERGEFVSFNEVVEMRVCGGRVWVGGWAVDANSFRVIMDGGKSKINGKWYRGEMEVYVEEDGGSFDVVNVIGIESYLAGVVGVEMPPYWEHEALLSQAIAARTYCYFIRCRFGEGRHWDVRRTQAHQAYGGIEAESGRIRRIVGESVGEVLFCEDDSGEMLIFPAYYSSICGGHSEDSENVFGGKDFVSLEGVCCGWCEKYSNKEFFFWGPVEMSKGQVSEKLISRYPQLAKLEEIIDIEVIRESEYDGYNRVTMIELVGKNGEKNTVRGEDFRLTLDRSGMNLKSCIFEVEEDGDVWRFSGGRGYGHGVGLCQYGAEGMARERKDAKEILEYYYPGSEIVNIYEQKRF